MNKAEKILEYIRSRPALNVTALANEAGMDRATLASALSEKVKRDLPEKWVEPLEEVLRQYGYEQENLVNALRDLHDLQNGPPLERDRDEWEEVMKRVGRLLTRHDAQRVTAMKRCRLKRYNFQTKTKMSKENKTSDNHKNGNYFIADVVCCARCGEKLSDEMLQEQKDEIEMDCDALCEKHWDDDRLYMADLVTY